MFENKRGKQVWEDHSLATFPSFSLKAGFNHLCMCLLIPSLFRIFDYKRELLPLLQFYISFTSTDFQTQKLSTFQKQKPSNTSLKMSDDLRKGVGEQVAEKFTPDSQKSTGTKIDENISGGADKAASAVQPCKDINPILHTILSRFDLLTHH